MVEVKIVYDTSETVFQVSDKKLEMVKTLLWKVCSGAQGNPTTK